VTEKGRAGGLVGAALVGSVCGLVGVAVMTAGEKIEQSLTKRPNSFVPARTLLSLLGRRPGNGKQSAPVNHAMHWGTGAILGALRGVWAITGMRGPYANAKHTVVRLAFDQTLENATGVGAPPTTWPKREVVVDLLHKTVYSVVTGIVADRLLAPELRSRRGVVSR